MSKKLLLGSTALVGAFALATPALADIEVTLSGQVEFGTAIADDETLDDGRGYLFFMDSETAINAEGAADNGINYGAKVELEVDADAGGDNVNSDETRVAFWGGFGRIEMGREDGASDNMIIGGEDFQAGTGGIDGDSVNLNIGDVEAFDSGDAAKITYFTPRIGGLQVGASYSPDRLDLETDSDDDADDFENFVEVGINYTGSFAGTDLTLAGSTTQAEAEDDGDDVEDYSVGVGVEFAGLGLGVGYTLKEDRAEGDGFTVGAKYGFGPANVSVGFSRADPDDGDESNVYAVSADYGLFPGVTVKGDVQHNDADPDVLDGDGDPDDSTAFIATVQVDY